MRFRSKLGGIAASTLVIGLWGAGFAGVASADTGSNVTTVPIVVPTAAANPEIQNDEPVSIVVPNGDLTPGATEHIYECDDPTGDIASADFQTPSPTSHPVISPSTCDLNMDPGNLLANANGGLSTPDPNASPALNNTFYIYTLPPANQQDKVYLNESGSVANCDLTHECILYIGPSLSSPYDGNGVVYSQPFFIDQNYDYADGNPAPPPVGTPEVSLALLLPIAAASLLGGVYIMMRRRKPAATI